MPGVQSLAWLATEDVPLRAFGGLVVIGVRQVLLTNRKISLGRSWCCQKKTEDSDDK